MPLLAYVVTVSCILKIAPGSIWIAPGSCQIPVNQAQFWNAICPWFPPTYFKAWSHPLFSHEICQIWNGGRGALHNCGVWHEKKLNYIPHNTLFLSQLVLFVCVHDTKYIIISLHLQIYQTYHLICLQIALSCQCLTFYLCFTQLSVQLHVQILVWAYTHVHN